jgi:hypothetical protein
MAIGFTFKETMSGYHLFQVGANNLAQFGQQTSINKHMHFTITWGPNDIFDFLWRDKLTCPLLGTITIGDMCVNVPCTGTIALHYHQGKIKYEINFRVNDIPYKFVGQKENIRPWNLHKSHTTLYGTICDVWTPAVLSKAVLLFKLDTLIPFLRSFRLRLT